MRGVSVGHLAEGEEQALEQLPAPKLLDDQQVLDQTAVREILKKVKQ